MPCAIVVIPLAEETIICGLKHSCSSSKYLLHLENVYVEFIAPHSLDMGMTQIKLNLMSTLVFPFAKKKKPKTTQDRWTDFLKLFLD